MDDLTVQTVNAEKLAQGSNGGGPMSEEVFEKLKKCAELQVFGYGNIAPTKITIAQIANFIGMSYEHLRRIKNRHAKLYSRLLAIEGHKKEKQIEQAAATARVQEITRRIRLAPIATDTYEEIMTDHEQPGMARIKAAEKVDEAIGLTAQVQQVVIHRLSESTISDLRSLRDGFGEEEKPELEAEFAEFEEVQDDDASAATSG